VVPSSNGDKIGIGERPDRKREVEAAAKEMDDVVAEHAHQPNVRILVEKIRQQRSDQRLVEQV
jgi:hypothetical protein